MGMSTRKNRRAFVTGFLGERLTCEIHAAWWAWRIPRLITLPTTHERALIEAFLQPGDLALDVGANSGCWTHAMAKRVGPSGFVHAFDIFPYYARAAARAMQLRGIRNAAMHAVGLGATESDVPIVTRGESGEVLTGRIHIAPQHGNTQELQRVPLRSLDGFADEHPELSRTRFMKITIEGAELGLFQGATRFLTAVRPVIYCAIVDEYCRRSGHRAIDVFKMIQSHDYDISSLDARGIPTPLVDLPQTGGAKYLLTPR